MTVKYYYGNWNKLNFLVVIVEVIFNLPGEKGLKMLRLGPHLARLFKLTGYQVFEAYNKSQRYPIDSETIQYSIPSILNNLSMLAFFYFIYSILGVFLLRKIEEGELSTSSLISRASKMQ